MSRVDEAEASVIVRVWFEDYAAHPIRFVVLAIGYGLPEQRWATTTIDDACAAVREALEVLTRQGAAGGTDAAQRIRPPLQQ